MLLSTIKVRKKYIKFHNSVLWHCRDDWYAARDVRQVTTKTPAPLYILFLLAQTSWTMYTWPTLPNTHVIWPIIRGLIGHLNSSSFLTTVNKHVISTLILVCLHIEDSTRTKYISHWQLLALPDHTSSKILFHCY